MLTFMQDLRYGLRMLVKSPGFTVVALLTLTLGIGATSAIFSVVDAVLLRSLPYRDPQRLVSIYEDMGKNGFPYNTPAPFNYAAWKAQTKIFEDVAAMSGEPYNLTGTSGEPEKLDGVTVTQNLFTLLGVKPALGRDFTPEEDQPGANRVALISDGLWKRRFAGDRATLGREISLNDEKYTVIGVMPPGFSFPWRTASVWTPIALGPKGLAKRGSHYLNVTGRLKQGVTLAEANSALLVLAKRLAKEYPDTNSEIERFFATPLRDAYTRDVESGLLVLFGAVGFILLIACANIANLLLSRAAGRQREIAVRTAIGASRYRIVRQLLTESALLALGGGAFGLLLADWCFAFLKNLLPADLAGAETLSLDLRVLAFAVAVSLGSSFLFGLTPALQVSRVDLNDVLKEGGRGSAGSRGQKLRNLLVIGEVALSLMLLVGSGLLLKSFANLRGLDPGFQPDHVLTMRIIVPRETKYHDFERRTQFFDAVLQRVRALPGVRSAGFTSALPLTWDGGTNSIIPEGQPLQPDFTHDANDRVVTPGYFETMRIPLRRGRVIDDRDGANAPPVAVINETMARKFWPNQDALDKRFKPEFSEKTPYYRIVGIVADVRQMALDRPARQEMYFSSWQSKENWMVPRDLVVRTAGDPLSLAGAVRRAVWSVDRDQPLSDIASLDDILDHEVSRRRIQATLLASLAGLALVLACVGIYGVLSYVVTQRTREIGVRVALGAEASDVFRTVATQGMGLAGIGVIVGIAASLGLTRLLTSMLFGVSAADPLTYFGAAVVFGLIALLACYVPARRAAKVDPMVALRYE